MLDIGMERQSDADENNNSDNNTLNASIARALKDAENGRVRPHEEVMADLRKRYGL